jgi:hypothetical protein
MNMKISGSSWIAAIALATALAAVPPAGAVEEASYTLVEQDGAMEIRDYDAQIVAEVVVDDSFEDAGDRAFNKLFRYISGANSTRGEIAMTAPVSQQKQGEKIAMTAPVGQRDTGRGWAVSFMMPAEYTMESLPRPTDPAVELRAVPPFRAAVVRYSGFWSERRYREHLADLGAWLQARGLEPAGEPVWARYNAPFTPWFMRRNEIVIPLATP